VDVPESELPENKILSRLQEMAEAMVPPPSWYGAALSLTQFSSLEERLDVYQDIRRSGDLPEEASIFLVTFLIDDISDVEPDETDDEYGNRMRAIEEQYGLTPGGIWPSGAAPAGYEELLRQSHQAMREFLACNLERFGEPEMARLCRDDPERFQELLDAGRRYFLGKKSDAENVPGMLPHFLACAIAGCMEAEYPIPSGPLGYRYDEGDGLLLIMDLYPTPVELIGGVTDGEVLAPVFSLDVEKLRGVFDSIDTLSWQSSGLPDAEDAHIFVIGDYRRRVVMLHILANAPKDEKPGMKLGRAR
jgi:hypothetical protein